MREMKAKDYGVTIEAQYAVGEYDILILGAKESTGLKDWLLDNGYKIPESAHEVLDPYIKQRPEVLRGEGGPAAHAGERVRLPDGPSRCVSTARSSCCPSAWEWPTAVGYRT